jgi:hypothetical protein
VTEVIDVTIRAQAADDGGTWRCGEDVALVADGDFAVVADADASLLTPDIGPPRTGRRGADHGAVFRESLLVGGVRGLAQFTVNFVLIGVGHELIQEVVGAREFGDALGGQQRDQAFLPVVVAAFDFAVGGGCELHPMRTHKSGISPSRIRFTRGGAGALN